MWVDFACRQLATSDILMVQVALSAGFSDRASSRRPSGAG
jgi:hypothetical protein